MKKIVKARFFQILVAGLCLFIFLYYAYVYINTTRTDELVQNLEMQVEMEQQTIDEKKELVESGEADAETERELNFWEDYIAKDKKELQALKDESWKKIVNIVIEKS